MKKIFLRLAITFVAATSTHAATLETAIFAGGCFWCMEAPFKKIEGVTAVKSGYSGGTKENPTYAEVSTGTTGHLEVVEVTYDPKKTTFAKLLDVFWRNIDPLDDLGQFCDKGSQYRTAVFYAGEAQKKEAEASLAALQNGEFKGRKITTKILAAKKFYPAEEYHQEYYLKNALQYRLYRSGCRRDKRLKEVWK